ncbi:hypothetical protein JJL45_08540 [Tamlana sp. s12]|uniref:hypothetical protein n=1 Tax=Tamlana sp. s12 TaxID=1630406 RepID=UPI0008018A3A|nr:hypothetical protein [Tamlana sp. s12]OBQ55338.1 hypothetical protein VQ01_07605 [Tamlana sp. s12]QQY80987.1 hypothetical protein JJL45_08540 [Tamlana sp. s12]
MIAKKQHIIFRILTLCVVATLLFPAASKFAHVLEHHNHKVCSGDDSTHFHQVDLDCEFQKFPLHTHILLIDTMAYWFKTNPPANVSITSYKTLKNHKPLSFSLRGPPVLV